MELQVKGTKEAFKVFDFKKKSSWFISFAKKQTHNPNDLKILKESTWMGLNGAVDVTQKSNSLIERSGKRRKISKIMQTKERY